MPNTSIFDTPRPRNWSNKTFFAYLGGTKEDISQVRSAMAQLIRSHNMMDESFKSITAKTKLKNFIEVNLHKLPEFVQDARHNPTRMDGLMGMVYKIKNEYQHNLREKVIRDKRTSLILPNTPSGQSDGNENGNTEDEGGEAEEDAVPMPAPEPEQQQPPAMRVEPSNRRNTERQPDLSTPNINYNKRPADTSSVLALEDTQPEPSQKRRRISNETQPSRPPGLSDMLSRNIWVLNELDLTRHGLCSIHELVQKPARNLTPQLSDLDYDHWLSIVQVQCGYDIDLHRLEYRPAPNININMQPNRVPLTVSMATQSQWRGAINSQLQTNPTLDPVFYMVSQSEQAPEPATPHHPPSPPPPPRNPPPSQSRNDNPQNHTHNHNDMVSIKQECGESSGSLGGSSQ